MGAVTLRPEQAADLARHFGAVSATVPLRDIEDPDAYEAAVGIMDALIDAGGAGENHPLAELVGVLGRYIADYDDVHYRSEPLEPDEILRELTATQALGPSDFPGVGDAGIVGAILEGRRAMTVAEARLFAGRLGVPAAIFA